MVEERYSPFQLIPDRNIVGVRESWCERENQRTSMRTDLEVLNSVNLITTTSTRLSDSDGAMVRE